MSTNNSAAEIAKLTAEIESLRAQLAARPASSRAKWPRVTVDGSVIEDRPTTEHFALKRLTSKNRAAVERIVSLRLAQQSGNNAIDGGALAGQPWRFVTAPGERVIVEVQPADGEARHFLIDASWGDDTAYYLTPMK